MPHFHLINSSATRSDNPCRTHLFGFSVSAFSFAVTSVWTHDLYFPNLNVFHYPIEAYPAANIDRQSSESNELFRRCERDRCVRRRKRQERDLAAGRSDGECLNVNKSEFWRHQIARKKQRDVLAFLLPISDKKRLRVSGLRSVHATMAIESDERSNLDSVPTREGIKSTS